MDARSERLLDLREVEVLVVVRVEQGEDAAPVAEQPVDKLAVLGVGKERLHFDDRDLAVARVAVGQPHDLLGLALDVLVHLLCDLRERLAAHRAACLSPLVELRGHLHIAPERADAAVTAVSLAFRASCCRRECDSSRGWSAGRAPHDYHCVRCASSLDDRDFAVTLFA